MNSYSYGAEAVGRWQRAENPKIEKKILEFQQHIEEKLELEKNETVMVTVLDAMFDPSSEVEQEMSTLNCAKVMTMFLEMTMDVSPVSAALFENKRTELEWLQLGQKITLAAALIGMVPSAVFMGTGAAAVGAFGVAANYADDAAILALPLLSRLAASSQFVGGAAGAVGSAVSLTASAVMKMFQQS